MSLAKFRHRYPQGSLVSELIEIDRGIYIVKALVEIDNIVLATALAGAATVEAAEDAARERAISALFLDERQQSVSAPAVTSQPNLGLVSSPPAPTQTKVSEPENVNFSKPQSEAKPDRPLTAVTVPLKPVAAVQLEAPETPHSNFESANSLFGDTFNAETPPLEPIAEANNDSPTESNLASELEAMDFNEIKQKTDIEIKRLSWTKEQGKEFLMSRYGKRSRLHLTDEQLLEFLRYLETLPNPGK